MITRSEFDHMLVIGLRVVFFLAAIGILLSMAFDMWTLTPFDTMAVNRRTVADAIMMSVFVWAFLWLALTLGKPEPEWNRSTKLSTVFALTAQIGLGLAYTWLMFWP